MKHTPITMPIAGALLLASATGQAAFPHKSAIYEMVTESPMMNQVSTYYVFYDGNPKNSIMAEWRNEEMMGQKKSSVNINRDGKMRVLDLNTKRCTETDVTSVTGAIQDPEALAATMRQQMNLQKSGSCEGAGLKGTRYTAPFGEMCFYKDAFMLWQNTMGSKIYVTNVKFDVDLPKDRITLPAGTKCVPGPDLSKGWQQFGGMGEASSPASGYDRADDNATGSAPSGQPSQEEMNKAMDEAKDMLKNLFSR